MVSAHHSGTHPLKPWKGHTKHCCLHSQLSTEEKGGKTHDFRTSLQQSSAQNRGRVTPKLANLILQTSDNLSMQHRCASGVLPQHSLRASGRSLCMLHVQTLYVIRHLHALCFSLSLHSICCHLALKFTKLSFCLMSQLLKFSLVSFLLEVESCTVSVFVEVDSCLAFAKFQLGVIILLED